MKLTFLSISFAAYESNSLSELDSNTNKEKRNDANINNNIKIVYN